MLSEQGKQNKNTCRPSYQEEDFLILPYIMDHLKNPKDAPDVGQSI